MCLCSCGLRLSLDSWLAFYQADKLQLRPLPLHLQPAKLKPPRFATKGVIQIQVISSNES